MTFATVTTALSQGYSISKIIQSILRMNTPLSKAIKEALKQGYNEDQIGEYLEKGKSLSYSQKNKMLPGMTEEEKARGIAYREPKAQKNIKGILESAAMAAPAAAAGYAAAPAIGAALGRAAPQIFGRGAIPGAAGAAANAGINPPTQPGPNSPGLQVTPSQPPSPTMQQTPQPQNQLQSQIKPQQPPVNQVAQNIAQPQQVTQPEEIINPKEYLEKKGILSEVDKLLKQGNTPDAIMGYININKKSENRNDPELLKNIESYAQQSIQKKTSSLISKKESPQDKLNKLIEFDESIYDKHFGKGFYRNNLLKMSEKERESWLNENADKFTPEDLKKFGEFYKNWNPEDTIENLQKQIDEQTTSQQPQISQGVESESAKLDETKETPKIAKSDIVATPQGVGEVKEIRNGKAIVEVDGKKHQVEEKSLLKPPKEAAIEALELIKSFTPEEQRSTHHMLNSYDEQEKKAFFVFHNGSAYVVDDISPEEYKELSEEIEKAKTTGETIIGKWAQGEGSRGSAYNKVVKGHRERKVVPELKKKFRKLKVGYNLLSEWQRLLNEKE